MSQPSSSDEDDGLTAYERMLKAGVHPCTRCIWFKGEVSLLCENHQHLAETLRSDDLDSFDGDER